VTRIAQEIPKVGLVMEEVRIVRWLKNVGDAVVAGETLLEVETEKSVVEIEAAASGRLAEILVPAESPATVGDQVGWIESADSAGEAATTPAPRRTEHTISSPTIPTAPMAPAAPPSPQAIPREGGRIRSTPAARSLAAEHGIDLGGIAGTGPGGRIQLDDVRHVIDRPRAGTRASATLPPMRRALARAMARSVATIPQFTVSRSVDWTVLQSLRNEYLERTPAGSPRLSVTDFLLQAVARSLIEFPALNSTFSGDPDDADASIVPAVGAHIGLVVAVDNGLLVPVMHDVERLDLNEIARRRMDCVERALKGRLKREESEGATFSISNLGADGPDRFTAIINPPQSAILAVGRQRDSVTARDGAVAVRPMSDLTLTVDHRVADGRLAAQFLARLVAILEGRDWQI
jgi:pyruvate dehydrogenase E2 component (dihydrolipoamide acetyltransferase)